MARFINPFTDWGFKTIFGQEINKDLLISFLNDLLDGEHVIADITFLDKEQLPELKDMRLKKTRQSVTAILNVGFIFLKI